jgi:hypothetical protein
VVGVAEVVAGVAEVVAGPAEVVAFCPGTRELDVNSLDLRASIPDSKASMSDWYFVRMAVIHDGGVVAKMAELKISSDLVTPAAAAALWIAEVRGPNSGGGIFIVIRLDNADSKAAAAGVPLEI